MLWTEDIIDGARVSTNCNIVWAISGLNNWIHRGPFFAMRKTKEPCERTRKQQCMLRPAKFEQLIKHPSRQLDKEFCE